MSKESTYRAQLEALGVYDPAFDGEIHQLCIMERELSRARKAWKATAPSKDAAPSFTDPHYEIIQRLQRDILSHRDALGLTPKGAARLRKAALPEPSDDSGVRTANPALTMLLNDIERAANE